MRQDRIAKTAIAGNANQNVPDGFGPLCSI